MASTLEVAHVIAAVLSVFHNAADLTKQISKRSKKKKGEQALRQKWLLETLESGELQISQKYNQYVQELGSSFKVGDDTSRDRIQHVAIIMQAELLRSLQLALEFEHTELDAGKLQDDAAFFRRDVLSALDDLKSRLLQQPSGQAASLFTQMVPTQRGSISSPTTPGTPGSGSGSFSPGLTLPQPAEEDSGGRMSRLFSIRSRPHKRSSTSSSTIQNMVVAPNLNWLGPAHAEPEKFELPAEDVPRPQGTTQPLYNDIKVLLQEPDTELLHPAMAREAAPIARNASTSTRSSDFSNYTRNSTFSDEKIPVLDEHDEAFFPDAADIAAALPPAIQPAPLNVRARYDRLSSTSSSLFGSTLASPTEPFPSISPITPSPTSPASDRVHHALWFRPDSVTARSEDPAGNNLPIPVRDRSDTASSGAPSSLFHRDSVAAAHHPVATRAPSTSTASSAHTVQLVGRPEKKNNYWGFCKGAWTIREDWRKGLHMQAVPSGMFGQDHVWQCRHCTYQGAIFGAHKPYTVDPRVHADAASDVRYRWLFLAKSHTKVRLASKQGEAGFGCLLCSLNNVHSSVYGNEALLFEHIRAEHAAGMTESLATRAHCVVGRKAEANEAFDINIL